MVKGEGVPMRREAQQGMPGSLPDLTGAGRVPTPIFTVPVSETSHPLSWRDIRRELRGSSSPLDLQRAATAEKIFQAELVRQAVRNARTRGIQADGYVAGILDASDAYNEGGAAQARFAAGYSSWEDAGSSLLHDVEQLANLKTDAYHSARNMDRDELEGAVQKTDESKRHVPRRLRRFTSASRRQADQTILDRRREEVADIVYNQRLIGGAYQKARKLHPEKTRPITYYSDDPSIRVNNDGVTERYVDAVVDASDAALHGNTAKVIHELGSTEGSLVMADAAPLADERKRIFVEAKTWDAKEVQRRIHEAHSSVQSLPKELRPIVYQRTTLKPETLREKYDRYKTTAKANIASILAAEGFGYFGGALGAGLNFFAGADLKTVALGVGASYVVWLSQLGRAAVENYRLMEAKGQSASVFANKFYEKYRYASKRKQKFMTLLGSAAYDLFGEFHYYLAAAGTSLLAGDWKVGAAGLALANILSGGKENIQADITEIERTKGFSLQTILPDIFKLKVKRNKDRVKQVEAMVIDLTARLHRDKAHAAEEGGKTKNAA